MMDAKALEEKMVSREDKYHGILMDIHVDTVLLPALPQLACLSSSVVRELAHFGRRWQDMLPEGLQYHINM